MSFVGHSQGLQGGQVSVGIGPLVIVILIAISIMQRIPSGLNKGDEIADHAGAVPWLGPSGYDGFTIFLPFKH
jgi:hypothetical protein